MGDLVDFTGFCKKHDTWIDSEICVWTKVSYCDCTKKFYLMQAGKLLGCNEHFNCQILGGN